MEARHNLSASRDQPGITRFGDLHGGGPWQAREINVWSDTGAGLESGLGIARTQRGDCDTVRAQLLRESEREG